jgi:hypothetical protein
LVFSSSMAMAVLCGLTVHHYADAASRTLTAVKFAVWLLVTAFGVSSIASRDHYTLDILVAVYTVPLLWLLCLKILPDRVPADFFEPIRVLPTNQSFACCAPLLADKLTDPPPSPP